MPYPNYSYNPINPYPNYMNFQPVQQAPQIQNGGLVPVQSEKEAAEYPVANGTSVTFLNTDELKLYIKTKGFSQLDKPDFKKYNLVEITDGEITQEPIPTKEYAEKAEIEALRGEIQALKEKINKSTDERRGNKHNG